MCRGKDAVETLNFTNAPSVVYIPGIYFFVSSCFVKLILCLCSLVHFDPYSFPLSFPSLSYPSSCTLSWRGFFTSPHWVS